MEAKEFYNEYIEQTTINTKDCYEQNMKEEYSEHMDQHSEFCPSN